jgi:serine/threonine protein kinase
VLENPSVGWSLAATDVGRMIVQLARSLVAVHDEGRVHADVKPANTVITAAGAVAIDPIGVTIGQVSPGATPGWAAPEQILARAVVPATDVYPLGLMVARLLGAAIYGEERSFLVPIGKGECRRVRLLADQDVFVDPEGAEGHVGLVGPVREAFQDFVRQCVAFDPDDRPQGAAVFAERLAELLEDTTLEWRLPLPGGPGTLRRDVDVLGAMQPSWVVSDFR